MSAAHRLGWTLDDLHERIAACEEMAGVEAIVASEGGEPWSAHAPLTFLLLAEELAAASKDVRLPVPATLLRKIRKLDEQLDPGEVARAASRLRSWLLRQESDLPAPDDGGDSAVDTGGNLVTLPPGALEPTGKERLRGLQARRWVAMPARADVRARAKAARDALSGLALILSAANADDDVPFGTLDCKRLSLVVAAARHMLGGPLAERGLLDAVVANARVMERRGRSRAVRATAKRARDTVELLLTDLP